MSDPFERDSGSAVPRMSAITRREVLKAAVAAGGLAMLPLSRALAAAYALPAATKSVLEKSPLIYISPLHKDGRESSCHGEVWYCVDGGSVLIGTGAGRWKARAVESGRDEARLWVGDFGPVQTAGDRYRSAPTFKAKAEIVEEDAVFTRLMDGFGKKYTAEWGKWGPRFKAGFADGSRVLIRYTPISA